MEDAYSYNIPGQNQNITVNANTTADKFNSLVNSKYYIYVKMLDEDDPSVGFRFDGLLSVTDQYVNEYGQFNERQKYINNNTYYTDSNSNNNGNNIISFTSLTAANKFAKDFLMYNYHGDKRVPQISLNKPLTFIDNNYNEPVYADDYDDTSEISNEPFIVKVTTNINM